MNKTGIISFIDGNKITVDGTKYSAFNPAQIKANVGDMVSFDYTEKHDVVKVGPRTGQPVTYRNIKGDVYPAGGMASIPTTGGVATPPRGYTAPPAKVGEPILAKDRLILRQNALTAAVNSFVKLNAEDVLVPEFDKKFADYVIAIAKRFEYYTSGDMDYDAAEKALAGDAVE